MILSKVYEDAERRLERNEITIGEFEQLVNIEVIEPKRGKWIDRSGGIEGAWNYCSVCGEQAIDLYDFCPNCGADMRKESE